MKRIDIKIAIFAYSAQHCGSSFVNCIGTKKPFNNSDFDLKELRENKAFAIPPS